MPVACHSQRRNGVGSRGLCGAQVELSGAVSSQYLTALLMAAPLATGSEGVHIRIRDELVSQPYVDMTVRLMERFGVTVRASSSCLAAVCMPTSMKMSQARACCAACAPPAVQQMLHPQSIWKDMPSRTLNIYSNRVLIVMHQSIANI